MPRIFDRAVEPTHPLEPLLGQMEGLATSSERFIAHNWRHDWRVAPLREARLLEQVVARIDEGLSPCSCYKGYYVNSVCRGTPPEYALACNQDNHVRISRRNWLARVLCLNHLREAAAEALPEVRMLPPDRWGAWLDARVEHTRLGGFLALRDFVDTMFSAWNNWSGKDQRPAWASFWADVEVLLNGPDSADHIRNAVGMARVNAGDWLVVLRYRVSEVPGCIRPTSLDADWNPYHFPSPRDEVTGFAMHLSSGAAGLCLPEVIHTPFDLTIEHWYPWIGRTTAPVAETDLAGMRKHHHERLVARFGNRVLDWMPSPI
jgi:hypothetical protein